MRYSIPGVCCPTNEPPPFLKTTIYLRLSRKGRHCSCALPTHCCCCCCFCWTQLYPRCNCWVAVAAAVAAVAAVVAAAVVAVAVDDVVRAGWQWTRNVAFPETCPIICCKIILNRTEWTYCRFSLNRCLYCMY